MFPRFMYRADPTGQLYGEHLVPVIARQFDSAAELEAAKAEGHWCDSYKDCVDTPAADQPATKPGRRQRAQG